MTPALQWHRPDFRQHCTAQPSPHISYHQKQKPANPVPVSFPIQKLQLSDRSTSVTLQLRPELVAIDNQAILTVLSQSPRNHLYGHTDANIININISQLSCDQRTLI
jgi:hypothetical protein